MQHEDVALFRGGGTHSVKTDIHRQIRVRH